ncbi:MAG: MBL fold metallo-hydrolase [Spirochaetia bacterium]
MARPGISVSITTLVENSAGDHKSLSPEHGVSFLIKSGDEQIIFDTGQSERFLRNAAFLGEDPAKRVSTVVLSHGHYDHTGGLTHLLSATEQRVSIHVGKGFFEPKYSVSGPALEYVGNRLGRAQIQAAGHRVVEHDTDVTEVADGVFLVTNFERLRDPDWLNPRFVIPGPSGFQTDHFNDEVSVVVKTSRGNVLLVGCSHPGILNIIESVRARFEEPLYAVLGGTHLIEASGSRLHNAIGALSELKDTLLGMSHCTGDTAMKRLAEVAPHYFHNHTGSTLMIG